MPTAEWFDAVTPDLMTAWADINAGPPAMTLDPVELDLATGQVVYAVRVGGFPVAGAPVSITDQSVAYSLDVFTNGNGEARIVPVAVGETIVTVGPTPTYGVASARVTVVDTREESALTITPSSPITLDLMTGGITLRAFYAGKRISGVEVSGANDGVVEIVDGESDAWGGIRIEPMAVGTTTITIRLTESYEYPLTVNGRPLQVNGEWLVMTGASDTITITVHVISSAPLAEPTTIRLAPWTRISSLRLCDGPTTIHVVDQLFRHLPMSDHRRQVEAEVSAPGYVTTSADALGGRFRVVPVACGVGKIMFQYHKPDGSLLYLERRFEVTP